MPSPMGARFITEFQLKMFQLMWCIISVRLHTRVDNFGIFSIVNDFEYRILNIDPSKEDLEDKLDITFKYLDDVLALNYPKFQQFEKEIYPKELTFE